ncbi:MAG TPA: GtrA family protein [Candidatus Limnocylindrales bacterium]|nr:GtrA family protein [Candidatus Limnocylindrales bacterium]
MGETNIVRRIYIRFQGILHELGKFGVVGAVAYLVDTAVYTLLLFLGMETLFAKSIATIFSTTTAFIGNRFWTWRHRPRSSLTKEYLLYFGFNAAGLGIQLATLGITHYGLGSLWPILTTPLADLVFAQIIGNGIATVFRFWAYRRFVFVTRLPAHADITR